MRTDVGFDVDQATLVLHAEAIAAGAVPKGDFRANNPHDTAEAHLHGLGGALCEESPCRLAGICHALYELTQYRIEARDAEGHIAAADATEQMRKVLRKHGAEYAITLERLLAQSVERHRVNGEIGRTEPASRHEIFCTLPAQTLQEMTGFLLTLERFEGELRASMSSFELQQSGDKRPRDLLLTAVYQHLRWGGLKYEQIAELVPDGLGVRDAAERVRARVNSDNARSMMPRELYGVEEKLRAEKRSKGSSYS
jgi:hypothetical protein